MKKPILTLLLCFIFLSGCSSFPAGSETVPGASASPVVSADTPASSPVSETNTEVQTEQPSESLPLESDQGVSQSSPSPSADAQPTESAGMDTAAETDPVVQTNEIQSQPLGSQYSVIKQYNAEIPSEIIKNIQYSQYQIDTDYLLITVNTANIRQQPTTESDKVGTASYFEKITLLAEVSGQKPKYYNTNIWYKVVFKKGTESMEGYILSSLAVPRTFQFDKMYNAIKQLKNTVDNSQTAYINNYKNRSGTPPLYHGSTVDTYGTVRYQSAPAYTSPDSGSEFRYISDGLLVSITGESGDYYKIETINFEGEYYVPKKYISLQNSINELTKVVVIDRKNQNEGVFEYIDGQWNIISYIYATTGENTKYKEPTPLGYYMAIHTQERFLYLDDVTRKIAGYAPFAIRFSGGAYIHGVPVDALIVNDLPIFQPMKEYLSSIGTVPRSHKCVRNYTSHALFLYEWISIGASAIIVIE